VASGETATGDATGGTFEPPRLGRADVVALVVWTLTIAAFFWDVVGLRRALFYFDITEINYPYRSFFAEELWAGRFSRWCPGLYCGLPLFSESQAGYLHPFKYLFYPWLETWQALNLDTVLSIWLAGAGTHLWLRRHVGPAAALTGAAILGLGGFTWAHIVHTSMINALASVPFVIWGLECSWQSGNLRGAVLGGLALACQVFAGHLQDALWMVSLVCLYGLYRAATEQTARGRAKALEAAAALIACGVLVSAVQWVPSKELLDRSPRAGGLSWDTLTYGSWHPELLPTLVVREAYGTRARDTDWMDGFYPYHEMDSYLGLIALGLAVVGAGGPRVRDRWANFWVLLAGLGAVLMLGRFTFLFDHAQRVPVLGSAREPVRFHLWVTIAVAGLAALGVERLQRPGVVSLRGAVLLGGALVALSIPIMIHIYTPVWTDPTRWKEPYHLDRYRWLGRELAMAIARTAAVTMLALWVARNAARSADQLRRRRWAALLPLLVMADLLGAHWVDVPTVDPRYWTQQPESARQLKSDPDLVRIFAIGDKHSGEPGYASERINFLAVRDPLDWSLSPVWHVPSSTGNTPMKSRRVVDYTDHTAPGRGRFDIEGVTHIVTGRRRQKDFAYLPSVAAGTAFIHRNRSALPRVRLAGSPVYAADRVEAIAELRRLTLQGSLRQHPVVEDPARPLATDAIASGTARIVSEVPERVVVETDSAKSSYLVMADTFDPGWTATVDGRPAPIRPAYVAFRAVYLPEGPHTVVFSYAPAGFGQGMWLSFGGLLLSALLWLRRPAPFELTPDHALSSWPPAWRTWWYVGLLCIVLASTITIGPGARVGLSYRWRNSVHTHTWGSGLEAMKPNRL
jgi:hypothetical protein